MTTHYIDLKVVPDAETNAHQLMGALFSKLHLALARQKQTQIGASFPQYNLQPRSPGHILRLHAEQAVLKAFMASDWLKGIRDHLRMTEVVPVPAHAKHRVVRRKQFKTNVERLRRRRMKRKGETAEQAKKAIPDTVVRSPNFPFLQIQSNSTAQKFCLFIKLEPLQEAPKEGVFNSYGLGPQASIPWF